MKTMMLLAAIALAVAPQGRQGASAAPTIVFVCAHGAGKSVIATAYFNKLAAERGLPYRAAFRGVVPQAELSDRVLEGLRRDGVAVPTGKPTVLGDEDVEDATHIFAIGCALPQKAESSGKAANWSDVPEDRGYEAMRDAIVTHVKQLLDDLQKTRKSAA